MKSLGVFVWNVFLAIAIGFLAPVAVLAQTGAGSMTGIISDQSGLSVPGAIVIAMDQATNVQYIECAMAFRARSAAASDCGA